MEEKTNLADFVEKNEFQTGGNAEPFPNGKTKITLSDAEVETTTITDPKTGATKERWIIHANDKSYWAGTQVMQGLKECKENGATEVIVFRKGEGMNTSYMVVNSEEVAGV